MYNLGLQNLLTSEFKWEDSPSTTMITSLWTLNMTYLLNVK